MKKLFRNRKAVSPVIATVLMIMVTMAGMTILFGFVISYSDAYKAGAGSSVMELLTVEDIWIKPGLEVQLSIYNAGKVDSEITSVYVNGLGTTKIFGSGDFNLAEKVAVGEHTSFKVYWTIPMNPSSSYTFTIATKMGSTFEVIYTAP
jgi:archaeal type IV pilus assembly protein PilA